MHINHFQYFHRTLEKTVIQFIFIYIVLVLHYEILSFGILTLQLFVYNGNYFQVIENNITWIPSEFVDEFLV